MPMRFLHWSVDEAVQWLHSVNFAHLEQNFREHGVDGETLAGLKQWELREELGIHAPLKERKALFECIQQLRGTELESPVVTGFESPIAAPSPSPMFRDCLSEPMHTPSAQRSPSLLVALEEQESRSNQKLKLLELMDDECTLRWDTQAPGLRLLVQLAPTAMPGVQMMIDMLSTSQPVFDEFDTNDSVAEASFWAEIEGHPRAQVSAPPPLCTTTEPSCNDAQHRYCTPRLMVSTSGVCGRDPASQPPCEPQQQQHSAHPICQFEHVQQPLQLPEHLPEHHHSQQQTLTPPQPVQPQQPAQHLDLPRAPVQQQQEQQPLTSCQQHSQPHQDPQQPLPQHKQLNGTHTMTAKLLGPQLEQQQPEQQEQQPLQAQQAQQDQRFPAPLQQPMRPLSQQLPEKPQDLFQTQPQAQAQPMHSQNQAHQLEQPSIVVVQPQAVPFQPHHQMHSQSQSTPQHQTLHSRPHIGFDPQLLPQSQPLQQQPHPAPIVLPQLYSQVQSLYTDFQGHLHQDLNASHQLQACQWCGHLQPEVASPAANSTAHQPSSALSTGMSTACADGDKDPRVVRCHGQHMLITVANGLERLGLTPMKAGTKSLCSESEAVQLPGEAGFVRSPCAHSVHLHGHQMRIVVSNPETTVPLHATSRDQCASSDVARHHVPHTADAAFEGGGERLCSAVADSCSPTPAKCLRFAVGTPSGQVPETPDGCGQRNGPLIHVENRGGDAEGGPGVRKVCQASPALSSSSRGLCTPGGPPVQEGRTPSTSAGAGTPGSKTSAQTPGRHVVVVSPPSENARPRQWHTWDVDVGRGAAERARPGHGGAGAPYQQSWQGLRGHTAAGKSKCGGTGWASGRNREEWLYTDGRAPAAPLARQAHTAHAAQWGYGGHDADQWDEDDDWYM